MKTKLMTLGALLSLSATGIATPVKMPDAQVLTSRLKENKFEHFIKETDFVKKVAGNDLNPLGVVVAINRALLDYAEIMKDTPIMADVMQDAKPMIFEACLQDHPEALKELKEKGFYKPINE